MTTAGESTRDFTIVEPRMIGLYEAALDDVEIGSGTRLLDVGCGPGLFLRLAAQRGAIVAGIDAAAPFVEIARERLPAADLIVGEMECLPFPDGSFDVVTGFNAFQLAADPGNALREAGRVSRPGAPIVVAGWGRPEQCEAAAYVEAVGSLLPPQAARALDRFAFSGSGTLEEFAARAGLTPFERREVLCVWSFPDEETLLRALKSIGFAVEAIDSAGEEAVTAAVLEAVAPYGMSDGGYRLENVFTYLIAEASSNPIPRRAGPMSEDREAADRDIEETLGLVPEFFERVPDYLLPTEWASFKSLQLSDQTAIPNKYKEMIGLAVSGATRCRYCVYFHTEAARLFGASEDEIVETALIAKNTMGWSTYLNTLQFDYDKFVNEFDQVTAHVREQMTAGATA